MLRGMGYSGMEAIMLSARLCGSLVAAFLSLCCLAPASRADEATYRLSESADDARPLRSAYTLTVDGQLEERVPGTDLAQYPLKSTATLTIVERRLPPSGARIASLRSLRYFESLQSNITVRDQKSERILPANQRLYVVRGANEELQYYALDRLMTSRELDLIRFPFDPLVLSGLLPAGEVKVGATWKAETWVLQLLTGVEAVIKGELTCKLDKVENDFATVSFSSQTHGGRYGASTEISFEGSYDYDLTQQLIVRVNVAQKEKSSISPVSPGLNVAANIAIERARIESHPELGDAKLAAIPLDPDPLRLLLAYDSPFGARLILPREWHVIQGKFVILRLMVNGSLISQATMMGLPQSLPGMHVSEEQFQGDIRKSLGDRLIRIVSAEEIPTDDGRFLYRVTALGKAQDQELVWKYYLCANTDGRQVSFVFSTEAKLAERLGERDLEIIRSISWPAPPTLPTATRP